VGPRSKRRCARENPRRCSIALIFPNRRDFPYHGFPRPVTLPLEMSRARSWALYYYNGPSPPEAVKVRFYENYRAAPKNRMERLKSGLNLAVDKQAVIFNSRAKAAPFGLFRRLSVSKISK